MQELVSAIRAMGEEKFDALKARTGTGESYRESFMIGWLSGELEEALEAAPEHAARLARRLDKGKEAACSASS
ncbi:hypothetical protein [Luteolibacter marinus]|uniref:hypothetical protein n=1 Tax=Luteolibacter marinus TaxID=2776705 RepID=UPI0018674A45|nr:hypothetical protein [Luteolibacter marinus]